MERHITFTPDAYAADPQEPRHSLRSLVPAGRHREPKAQLSLPEVQQVAEKHGKTCAQVLLRWQLQTGCRGCPRQRKRAHIAENLDIFDFTLDEADLAALAKANSGKRVFDVPLSAQTDMIMGFKFND